MKGFTLVETVVVVSLTTLVGLGLLAMITFFYRSNAFLLEATSAVDSASRGLNEALESLREASYAEDGTYPLASAATSSVTFYGDMDDDASVERVRLYLSGYVLYRGVTNAGGNPPSYAGQTESVETIATWVKNANATPVFRYFDDDGLELTGTIDISRVRSVRTRLDVDINPQRAPNILILEGAATLRNLRTE
jgi:type II secretory pathway pseudopilin PulG